MLLKLIGLFLTEPPFELIINTTDVATIWPSTFLSYFLFFFFLAHSFIYLWVVWYTDVDHEQGY